MWTKESILQLNGLSIEDEAAKDLVITVEEANKWADQYGYITAMIHEYNGKVTTFFTKSSFGIELPHVFEISPIYMTVRLPWKHFGKVINTATDWVNINNPVMLLESLDSLVAFINLQDKETKT